MKIDIFFCNVSASIDFRKFVTLILKLISEDSIFNLLPEDTYLSVAFVDNKKIRELNKVYRNIGKPTDVLSFPFNERTPENYILGEVIVSQEIAFDDALKNKISWREEIAKLIIHGMLHLVNYSHETDEEEKEMNFHELRLLKQLRGTISSHLKECVN